MKQHRHKYFVYKETEVPTGQYLIDSKVEDIGKYTMEFHCAMVAEDYSSITPVTKTCLIIVCETCGNVKIKVLKLK